MHDPMAVAHEIKLPWKWRGSRPTLVTIWHVDPERDGSDDSCDWFNRGKAEDRQEPKRQAVFEALWDMETILDNCPHFPSSPEHLAFQPLKAAIRAAFAPPPRPWWRHPRWHFWHWRIQLHPWQQLKRYYWDKCCICGKRGFHGEAAMGNWDGDKIWHSSCDAKIPRPPVATVGPAE